MKIIGLTGLPRSGKNTAADYIMEHYGYGQTAFADPLKGAASILLSRPYGEVNGDDDFDREAILPEWGFSTRDFLQRFGTEAMRNNFGADFWVKHMRNILARCAATSMPGVVITDVRFPNEVDMIRGMGGWVVGVYRPGLVASSHVSDAGVTPDLFLPNTSTLEAFRVQISTLMGLLSHATPTSRSA